MQQFLPGAWNAIAGVAVCFNNRLQVNLLIQKSSIFGGGDEACLHYMGTQNKMTDIGVPRIPVKFLCIVWKSCLVCCKCVKIKKPMLFDENKNKLANLRSVRSGTIRQRINRTGQNVLLFHPGKCQSPHNKLLNGYPRWIRRTLANSRMWPHRSLDLNPCDYL